MKSLTALKFVVIAAWKSMASFSKLSMMSGCTDQAQQILLRLGFASIAIEETALTAMAKLISDLM